MRARGDPPLEKGARIAGDVPAHARARHDHRDIREPVPHIGESRVPLAVDVHLAVVRHFANIAVVADEGEAARAERVARDAYPARDGGAEPVGADDEAGANVSLLALGAAHACAAHGTSGIS